MIVISKSELTKQLEDYIWRATNKMGTFGCFEVTLGLGGRERIDFLTYSTKGIWRCYEVKSSLQDFNSKCKHTFVGHYNYYVMTNELFEKVKDKIPSHVGVYTNGCVKKPKKQELAVDEDILKVSMIRSLFREYEKLKDDEDSFLVDRVRKRNEMLKRTNDKLHRKLTDLHNKIFEMEQREDN